MNVRVDYGKLRHLLVVGRQLNGNFDLLRHVAGEERVACDIQPGFPLERLTRRENFLSLLHFFGLLSIREVADGRPVLAIPNQTVRRLLYGFLRDAYDDVGTFAVDLFAFDQLMSAMANAGAWRPVFEFLRDAVAAQTGIRDYIAGEKVLQGFLAAYLSVCPYFVFRSEAELGKGYADIALRAAAGAVSAPAARLPDRAEIRQAEGSARPRPPGRGGAGGRRDSSAAISPTSGWRGSTRPCASSAWSSFSTAGNWCAATPSSSNRSRRADTLSGACWISPVGGAPHGRRNISPPAHSLRRVRCRCVRTNSHSRRR